MTTGFIPASRLNDNMIGIPTYRERKRESWWLVNYYVLIFSMIEIFCVVDMFE